MCAEDSFCWHASVYTCSIAIALAFLLALLAFVVFVAYSIAYVLPPP